MSVDQFDRLRLTDRRAIVTGAASGIGEAIARKLAARGARVVVADLDLERARQVVADIGSSSLAARVDITSKDEIDGLYAAADAFLGGLDILVNNAGMISHGIPYEEYAEDEWDRTMAVNVKGAFLMTQQAVPRMQAAGGGAIVNVSSVAGVVASPQCVSYNASKAGVLMVGEAAAVEFKLDKIRVNNILPGFTSTPMFHGMDEISQEMTEAGVTLTTVANAKQLRLGEPDDHAELAAFLVSDAASFITGINVVIDGGLHLGVL
jgi:3-oxoacyl-[acyl-carrier protein] reductase